MDSYTAIYRKGCTPPDAGSGTPGYFRPFSYPQSHEKRQGIALYIRFKVLAMVLRVKQ
jgi:hypothetical protein